MMPSGAFKVAFDVGVADAAMLNDMPNHVNGHADFLLKVGFGSGVSKFAFRNPLPIGKLPAFLQTHLLLGNWLLL